MPGPIVSAADAARLSATYPQLAGMAAQATKEGLVISDSSVGGQTVNLSRHRLFQMPTGQVVSLDEIDALTTTLVADTQAVVAVDTAIVAAAVVASQGP